MAKGLRGIVGQAWDIRRWSAFWPAERLVTRCCMNGARPRRRRVRLVVLGFRWSTRSGSSFGVRFAPRAFTLNAVAAILQLLFAAVVLAKG
jgi:hypothetical protein